MLGLSGIVGSVMGDISVILYTDVQAQIMLSALLTH